MYTTLKFNPSNVEYSDVNFFEMNGILKAFLRFVIYLIAPDEQLRSAE